MNRYSYYYRSNKKAVGGRGIHSSKKSYHNNYNSIIYNKINIQNQSIRTLGKIAVCFSIPELLGRIFFPC